MKTAEIIATADRLVADLAAAGKPDARLTSAVASYRQKQTIGARFELVECLYDVCGATRGTALYATASTLCAALE